MSRTTTYEVEISGVSFKLMQYPDGARSFHVDDEQVEDVEAIASDLEEVLSWIRPPANKRPGFIAAHNRAGVGERSGAVFKLFADGADHSIASIARVVGCTRSASEKAIIGLVTKGKLRKTGPGLYALATREAGE